MQKSSRPRSLGAPPPLAADHGPQPAPLASPPPARTSQGRPEKPQTVRVSRIKKGEQRGFSFKIDSVRGAELEKRFPEIGEYYKKLKLDNGSSPQELEEEERKSQAAVVSYEETKAAV